MTKVEMIKEMFEKGYKSQYSVEWFEESFTKEQIKVFYDKFMEYLGEVKQTSSFFKVPLHPIKVLMH